MTSLQDLISKAEAKPHQVSAFEILLAEHLAPLAHPLPHPERYDHGYVKSASYTVPQVVKPAMNHPGPITMAPPAKPNWAAIATIALMLSFWAAATYCSWFAPAAPK